MSKLTVMRIYETKELHDVSVRSFLGGKLTIETFIINKEIEEVCEGERKVENQKERLYAVTLDDGQNPPIRRTSCVKGWAVSATVDAYLESTKD